MARCDLHINTKQFHRLPENEQRVVQETLISEVSKFMHLGWSFRFALKETLKKFRVPEPIAYKLCQSDKEFVKFRTKLINDRYSYRKDT